MRPTLAVALVFAIPHFAAGQPFVEHTEPPVVQTGKTTRVAFVGKELANALDVWCSVPGVTATRVGSAAGKAVFDIAVKSDAPTGVCGVRVATRDGLSNAALFLIDDLTVRASDSGASLSPPVAVWGTFREATVDRFTFAVKTGERVSFEAVANRFGKDADPLITLRDAEGKWVAERDNDAGLYYDAKFAHTFEKAGTYTVEVRDARFKASEHHKYVLRVGSFSPDRLAPGWSAGATTAKPPSPEREAAFAQATSPPAMLAFTLSPFRTDPFLSLDRLIHTGRFPATPAPVPGTLAGVLRTPGARDLFLLKLEKGQRVFVRGEAKALNSPAELELSLTDRVGRVVRNGQDDSLDYTAGAAGEFGLVVRDQLRDGSDAHAYRLTMRSDPFPPQLTAEVEGLTLPRGSYQPVPIVVTRPDGPLSLSLEGAPPGLTLTPSEISAGSPGVVCKLEATSAAPLGVHTVRIVAGHKGEKVAVRTLPLIDRKLVNVDLIPIALREDQTRLPASLTDRFAVQVTPPSPFTFELPEPSVTLGRYQKAAVPVKIARTFDGPLSFQAVGGQLADKNEGRTRVYAEFGETGGVVVSKILSNTAKARIDVTATATHAGRRVSLTRCFDLDIVTAFKVAAEPAKVSLRPGESAKARLTVSRLKTFDGPVTLRLNPMPGVTLPETVTVPGGAAGVDIDIAVSLGAEARRQNLQLHATADVDGFEEELRAQPVEIEIRKVEPPKKK